MWFCSIIKNQQKTNENLKSFGGKLLFSNINFLCHKKKKKKPFSIMDGNELIFIFLQCELGCTYRLTWFLPAPSTANDENDAIGNNTKK